MKDPDKRSDIERLLAEAEAAIGGGPPPVVPRGGEADAPARRALSTAVGRAAVSGLTAAAVIWVVFAFLPFLGAPSGAVAAFVSTFITVLVLRRR